MGPLTVMLAGSEQQQRAYLPPFCDAQGGYLRHGSLAFAERTGGYTLGEISATVRMDRSTPSGDTSWIVNGTKRDVIHGAASSPRVSSGTTSAQRPCGPVVPDETPGLRITHDDNKLGLIAAPSASYTLEEARLPADSLLGEPGHPGVVRAATLYQLLRAGVACGMARAGLEYAADYARQRIAFGRPIVSYQGIAFMFAEMAMKLDAARLLLWRAATSWDKGTEVATLAREAEAAHYQALKIAKSATIDTIQILGGAGFMQDHPAEMWMRNAAAME